MPPLPRLPLRVAECTKRRVAADNASRTLGGHHYTIGRARYLSRSVVRWPVAAVNAGRRAASRCVMNAGNRPASLRHLDHNCSENGNLAVSMPSPGGRSARRIRISMIVADSHAIVSAPLPYRPSGQSKICPSETVHWFRTGRFCFGLRACRGGAPTLWYDCRGNH